LVVAKALTSANFQSIAKKKFVIKLSWFWQNFVRSWGAQHFRVHYKYSKSDFKLNFEIVTNPIQK
jgi:hypothetical protein